MSLQRIHFERTYGIRQIQTGRGERITAVSQPDWPHFTAALGALARQGAGNIVTTPELMTSTDIDLAALHSRRLQIAERVTEATAITRSLPGSTVVLGSVVFDAAAEKPRNAVLFLRDGEEVGRSYKSNPIGKYERTHLDTTKRPGDVSRPLPNILTIICSDLVDLPPLDQAVDTLLVSACWGTPSGHANVPVSSDERHLSFLRYLTDDLFDRHDQLETIAMTDRAPGVDAPNGPYNFTAHR